MYVCICKGVNDKKIRQEVREGRGRLCDLKENLGVGSQCGQCIDHATAVIFEETPISEFLDQPLSKAGKIAS